MGKPRLLFISNLFPDTREPYRGLDNATVLHCLKDRWEIRAIGIRPSLPWQSGNRQPREEDRAFEPEYLGAPYVPKIGSLVNHHLMASALEKTVQKVREKFPFDLVLSSWIFPDSCAVAKIAARNKFRFVSIAQGSDVHQYLQNPRRQRIIMQSMPAASGIITRSAELATLLAKAGLDRTKLHPIYNGVDLETFSPADPLAARTELNLPTDRPIILFVGNFFAIKNPLRLIQAHAELCSGPSIPLLVLAGGGPMEGEIRALAEQLGSLQHVHFAGRLKAAAVARYMQAADFLCLPSRNEGVPNVILEAFASGLPVVASRVGGIPEVHTGDHLGRLVDADGASSLAEGMRVLLSNPLPREPIRTHGLQFSWERASAQYHAILEKALS